MTDQEWLVEYDKWAPHIHDDILDEADERFDIGVNPGQTMSIPDAYYIWVAQRWITRLNYDC